MTFVAYDAVTIANIPATATHIFYYVDGRFANGTAAQERFPKAERRGITVAGQLGAAVFAVDCEAGDLTPAQAEGWVASQLALKVYRPCVYASLSTWEDGLLAALEHYGDSIRRWVAAFPGAGVNVPAGYDAHQYSDNGGAYDTSVCLPDFFDTMGPAPQPKGSGVVSFAGTFDLATGKWAIKGTPGENVEFAGAKRWASAEVQINIGVDGGQWRVRGIHLNAAPLGG